MNFQSYQERARVVARQWEAKRQAILANQRLSPEAKAEDMKQADIEYRESIHAIQMEASSSLEQEQQRLGQALQAARRQAAQAERELLGPEIAYRLLERQFSATQLQELPELLEGARDEWERTILSRLAQTLPEESIDSAEPQAIAARARLQRLTAGSQEPELAKLEAESQELARSRSALEAGQLDPVSYRISQAEQYQVNPAYMEL